jgi:hypothetical protein
MSTRPLPASVAMGTVAMGTVAMGTVAMGTVAMGTVAHSANITGVVCHRANDGLA